MQNGIAQSNVSQKKTTRMLFVLDGSGSMEGKWSDIRKFDIAKKLLVNSVDSLNATGETIEIGLRIFGHQSHKDFKDCEDSRLEIDFEKGNAKQIYDKLNSIQIQGQTPIAYSLFQAVNDFPFDPFSKNVIILITDGMETCDGDPCAVAGILKSKNIALRPFVIGLGLGDEAKQYFDCVGTYYDAENESTFKEVLDIVISQAINNTTAQVNLLDIKGKPTETNVEMTFYDAFSGQIENMLVHAIDYYERVDTYYLSPVVQYDLTVHTVPPVTKRNINLTPGKHNIISVDVPQGYLILKIDGFPRISNANALIRITGNDTIIDVQIMNSRKKLLVGKYDLELLTLPPIHLKEVEINQSKETEILVPSAGKLKVLISRPGIVSLYQMIDNKMKMIYEVNNLVDVVELEMIPGEYIAVYRQNKFHSSELTQEENFIIKSRLTTNVRF